MAKLTAPLLSIRAHGTLADKVTYRHSKGLDIAQLKSVPSDPESPAQTTQRDRIKATVGFWRHELAGISAGAAWTTAAAVRRRAGSGYQYATSTMTRLQDIVANPSIVVGCVAYDPQAVRFELANLSDYSPGTEAGNFDVWAGPSASSLTYKESLPIVTPFVTTSPLGAGGEIVYVLLCKDGVPRSGLHEITLVDGGGMSTTYLDNLQILGDVELIGNATGFPAWVPFVPLSNTDFGTEFFIKDSAYHTLDISGVIPVGAIGVTLSCFYKVTATSKTIAFRRDENDAGRHVAALSPIANVFQYFWGACACTPARTIQYLVEAGTWPSFLLTLTGYYL